MKQQQTPMDVDQQDVDQQQDWQRHRFYTLRRGGTIDEQALERDFSSLESNLSGKGKGLMLALAKTQNWFSRYSNELVPTEEYRQVRNSVHSDDREPKRHKTQEKAQQEPAPRFYTLEPGSQIDVEELKKDMYNLERALSLPRSTNPAIIQKIVQNAHSWFRRHPGILRPTREYTQTKRALLTNINRDRTKRIPEHLLTEFLSVGQKGRSVVNRRLAGSLNPQLAKTKYSEFFRWLKQEYPDLNIPETTQDMSLDEIWQALEAVRARNNRRSVLGLLVTRWGFPLEELKKVYDRLPDRMARIRMLTELLTLVDFPRWVADEVFNYTITEIPNKRVGYILDKGYKNLRDVVPPKYSNKLAAPERNEVIRRYVRSLLENADPDFETLKKLIGRAPDHITRADLYKELFVREIERRASDEDRSLWRAIMEIYPTDFSGPRRWRSMREREIDSYNDIVLRYCERFGVTLRGLLETGQSFPSGELQRLAAKEITKDIREDDFEALYRLAQKFRSGTNRNHLKDRILTKEIERRASDEDGSLWRRLTTGEYFEIHLRKKYRDKFLRSSPQKALEPRYNNDVDIRTQNIAWVIQNTDYDYDRMRALIESAGTFLTTGRVLFSREIQRRQRDDDGSLRADIVRAGLWNDGWYNDLRRKYEKKFGKQQQKGG